MQKNRASHKEVYILREGSEPWKIIIIVRKSESPITIRIGFRNVSLNTIRMYI